MKSDSEEQRSSGGFWHGLNNLLTTLAILWLFWSLLEFLWKRKTTAWLGSALLLFVPIWLGISMIVSALCWIVTDEYLTSDAAFEALTVISALITLVVSVGMTIGDNPPVGRRERKLGARRKKWAAQYARPTSSHHRHDRR
jgi:hypothetical protein